MMTQIGFDTRRSALLLAGTLALFSQAALSDEARAARAQPAKADEVRVSAPSQEIAIADPKIQTDAEAAIDAINRRINEDLERRVEAMSGVRIELVISEFPTRG